MITREYIFQQMGQKPFAPFRVILTTGEQYEITGLGQATATKRQMILANQGDKFMWIPFEKIDRLDPVVDQK